MRHLPASHVLRLTAGVSLSMLLLSACGPETLGTAATAGAAKAKELEQARAVQEQVRQQLQQSVEQGQQRNQQLERAAQ